jgi:RNA polymerase sigma-70 factor (ECF subfamily)
MNAQELELRWKRLTRLLEPIHGQAVATARRLCRTRADGDDLYQETVLRAFDKLHTLRDESRFRSWFYVTLLSRHKSRTRLRFWKRFVPLEDAFPPGHDPAGEDGSRWLEEAERAKRAALALDALAAVQREAVVLFEIEEHSIEEIAVLQRASVSAVKTRLSRGRERLRRFYEQHGWVDRLPAPEGSASGPTPPRSGPARDSGEVAFARLATAVAFTPSEKEGPHE